MDFSKFDKMVDIDGLKKDIADAEANGGGADFKDVPHGYYEVSIDKLELTETKKTGKPMVSCWMKIIGDCEFKGQRIFMNQVITQGFQIHIMNSFLRSLLPDDSGIDVEFTGYADYNDLLLDITEYIDHKFEYAIEYGENNKGFDTFQITDIFELD